jgi:hypothetical protein
MMMAKEIVQVCMTAHGHEERSKHSEGNNMNKYIHRPCIKQSFSNYTHMKGAHSKKGRPLQKPIETSNSWISSLTERMQVNFWQSRTKHDKTTLPGSVHNADETRLCTVRTKIPQVLGLEGKRQIASQTATEPSFLKITICSKCVDGTVQKGGLSPQEIRRKILWKEPLRVRSVGVVLQAWYRPIHS